jgi:hypothetical protein
MKITNLYTAKLEWLGLDTYFTYLDKNKKNNDIFNEKNLRMFLDNLMYPVTIRDVKVRKSYFQNNFQSNFNSFLIYTDSNEMNVNTSIFFAENSTKNKSLILQLEDIMNFLKYFENWTFIPISYYYGVSFLNEYLEIFKFLSKNYHKKSTPAEIIGTCAKIDLINKYPEQSKNILNYYDDFGLTLLMNNLNINLVCEFADLFDFVLNFKDSYFNMHNLKIKSKESLSNSQLERQIIKEIDITIEFDLAIKNINFFDLKHPNYLAKQSLLENLFD